MTCCGGKRVEFYRVTPHQAAAEHLQNAPIHRIVQPMTVYFQYVGRTGLTVTGPITGRQYRFNHTGAVVGVDGRDAGSMAAVPHLRRAKNPG